MNQQKTVHHESLIKSLVPMDMFAGDFPLRIELAYGRGDNLLFGQRIYREGARLWLHESLAGVVLAAAAAMYQQHGLSCVLYDGLRTVEAQAAMLETQRVKDNPQWLEEPRLLSPPGAGAHPRAMAIDVSLEGGDGQLLDMGSSFDSLAQDSSPAHNPAHREHNHPAPILENRKILDDAMTRAAAQLGVDLLLLPQEWWDFRIAREIYEKHDPLTDIILPPQMKMMDGAHESGAVNFDAAHFEVMKERLLRRVKAQV